MLIIEYVNRRIKPSTKHANSMQVDRVVLKETVLANSYDYIAGEVLGGHKVIYLKDNKVYLASNNNFECFNRVIGITKNSAIENGVISIAKNNDTISLTGWGLVPNTLYYLGTNGAITYIQPMNGIVQLVGIAKNENELEININLPIVRN